MPAGRHDGVRQQQTELVVEIRMCYGASVILDEISAARDGQLDGRGIIVVGRSRGSGG